MAVTAGFPVLLPPEEEAEATLMREQETAAALAAAELALLLVLVVPLRAEAELQAKGLGEEEAVRGTEVGAAALRKWEVLPVRQVAAEGMAFLVLLVATRCITGAEAEVESGQGTLLAVLAALGVAERAQETIIAPALPRALTASVEVGVVLETADQILAQAAALAS